MTNENENKKGFNYASIPNDPKTDNIEAELKFKSEIVEAKTEVQLGHTKNVSGYKGRGTEN